MNNEFANRLKKIRKVLGLDQKPFCEEIGITQSNYSQIETGRTKISIDFIKKIVETYNVNPYFLLFGEGKAIDDLRRLSNTDNEEIHENTDNKYKIIENKADLFDFWWSTIDMMIDMSAKEEVPLNEELLKGIRERILSTVSGHNVMLKYMPKFMFKKYRKSKQFLIKKDEDENDN